MKNSWANSGSMLFCSETNSNCCMCQCYSCLTHCAHRMFISSQRQFRLLETSWSQDLASVILMLNVCRLKFLLSFILQQPSSLMNHSSEFCVSVEACKLIFRTELCVFTGRQHSIALLCKPCTSYVCLPVCPSVRHTLTLCENDASQDHKIFTDRQPKDSSFWDKKDIQKFERVHPERWR